jgi:adenylate cyclase
LSDSLDPETRSLLAYLRDRGATDEEVREATASGTLGPLAVEVALREPGESLPFAEAVAAAGVELDEAEALWRALGFPSPAESGVRLTAAQVETLRVLRALSGSLLGPETTIALARVLGGACAQLAEAVVDSFRIRLEIPRLSAGQPYPKVAEEIARVAEAMFPSLADAVAEALRGHVLAVARAGFALDEEQTAITRELSVGFVDLVGYTRRSRSLSPAALSNIVTRFETCVGDVVSRRGGRVVKLIGDEAMFVAEDAQAGYELASTLMRTLGGDDQLPAVRLGMAYGPVVAHHGDYFGDVVNLAARLVKAAEPDQALLSQGLAEEIEDSTRLSRIESRPLEGYDEPVATYALPSSV